MLIFLLLLMQNLGAFEEDLKRKFELSNSLLEDFLDVLFLRWCLDLEF